MWVLWLDAVGGLVFDAVRFLDALFWSSWEIFNAGNLRGFLPVCAGDEYFNFL